MSFWEYLVKNKLWLLCAFMLLCAVWALVWVKQGDAGVDLKIMGISVGFLVIVFIVGNYIKWKQLR